jgi:glycosyltransferase involved in cell wall biosynthesis
MKMKMMINGRCLEGRRTGVGRYLSNILQIWTKEYREHAYDIYLRNEIPSDLFLGESNVSAVLVPNSKLLDLGPVWENFYLPRALRKNTSADVYFSPLNNLPAYPLNCKQVVTIFDISYIAHPEWFPKKQFLSLRLLTGPTVRNADIILTGSQATKKEIIKYYDVDENKISVTNLGVDQVFIDLERGNIGEQESQVRKKYNLTGKVVLFVGLIMNRRNVPVLMEAVSNIIRKTGEIITLVIIGKNHTFPYFDVKEVAAKYGIEGYIRWIEYTTDHEIFGFYKAADVFVCSSLYEGFNIPPLEALFMGVPVICSNLSSLPEVVGDAAYMLEDPRDPIEMAEAIESVLTDPSLQAELIQKGRSQASNFSWQRCAKETMDVIKALD